IEVIHDQYMMAFFIRLGTTTVGLVVSTLVNMFIFPPNYQKVIQQNLQEIYHSIAKALQSHHDTVEMKKQLAMVKNMITKTKKFIVYELDEKNLRPFIEKSESNITDYEQLIDHIELIHYHVQTISNIHLEETAFSQEQKE